MMDPGWSFSEHRVDADTAWCGIIWQHERIRALLDTARSVAEANRGGEARSPEALACAIADIRLALEAHFAYEKRHWLPQADQIVVEHDQQWDLLDRLHREACAGPSSPELAASLTFFAAWMLSHMAEEERCLGVPSIVSDDFFVIPRRTD